MGATYQLRQHLFQLVHVHESQVLRLGLPDAADGCFCRDTGGECAGVEDGVHLPPTLCAAGSSETWGFPGTQNLGAGGKMGKRCVCVVSQLRNMRGAVNGRDRPGGHQRTLPGPLGSPTTKIFSSSATSRSASPLTARWRGVSHRIRAPLVTPVRGRGPTLHPHPDPGLPKALALCLAVPESGPASQPVPTNLWSCHP